MRRPPDARLLVGAVAPVKPGVRTSEFYLSLAVITAAVVLAIANTITGAQALDAVKWVAGAYAISRGAAKLR